MKILIIALSGIGDALMFTPTLDKINAEYPDATIDVLTMYKGISEIYSNFSVNKVFYFNFMKEGIKNSLLFINKLRKEHYDISINVYPSNRKEYNIINFLIGAKKRLAAKYIRQDFVNFGFLNNIRILENDNTHNVETNFKLFSKLSNTKKIAISQLKIVLNKEDVSFADKYLSEHNILQDDIVVGFHTGSNTLKNHINRRWSPEQYSELGRLLINNFNVKIMLFGSGEEIKLNKNIADSIDCDRIIVVEAETLTKSAAIMKRCNVFITNDSALLHIASALKLNIIAIIGPTNINYIHPWQTNYKIASLNLDCSPCFFYSTKPLNCSRTDLKYKCIKEITPTMVFELSKNYI